jgi:Flp pilus assembly protein TadB
VNHTRFPKEDHLPDWARRDNKVTKGDVQNMIQALERGFWTVKRRITATSSVVIVVVVVVVVLVVVAAAAAAVVLAVVIYPVLVLRPRYIPEKWT